MGRIFHPERTAGVDPRLVGWLNLAAKELPFDLIVMFGVRTEAEQLDLYAEGRTKPGPHAGEVGHPPLGDIVTKALPEQSAHCHGGALDVAPFVSGKVPWEIADPGWALWPRLGAHAMLHGFEWGGSGQGGWAHFCDKPHVEVVDWRTLPMIR